MRGSLVNPFKGAIAKASTPKGSAQRADHGENTPHFCSFDHVVTNHAFKGMKQRNLFCIGKISREKGVDIMVWPLLCFLKKGTQRHV